MKIFKKIKARFIAKYIIKQIKKYSKNDTHNMYLRVAEKNKTKYIYVKFNIIDGVKNIDMNFIEYCKSSIAPDNSVII